MSGTSIPIGSAAVIIALLSIDAGCGSRTGLVVDETAETGSPVADSMLPDAAPQFDAEDTAEVPVPSHAQVVAGYANTCLVLEGVLRCWGDNRYGQLGDGTTLGPRTTPFVVPGLGPVAEVNLGAGTCVRHVDGTVKCWGDNVYGEVGNGVTSWPSKAPVLVPTSVLGIENAVALAPGISSHNCAQLGNGTVACWGNDAEAFDEPGKVGRDQPIPVVVHALEGAKSVSKGNDYTCALFADGSVQCTGYNLHGELGEGTSGGGHSVFGPVVDLPNAVAIKCGDLHTCAIVSDRTARCWGDNERGELGIGTVSPSDSPETRPVVVKGLGSVKELALGELHSCALLFDGSVQCWGANGVGSLGDGTTTNRSAPGPVPGLSNVFQITAGGGHTCALTADGRLFCWGFNKYGQLGDGTTLDRHVPTEVTW